MKQTSEHASGVQATWSKLSSTHAAELATSVCGFQGVSHLVSALGPDSAVNGPRDQLLQTEVQLSWLRLLQLGSLVLLVLLLITGTTEDCYVIAKKTALCIAVGCCAARLSAS